LLLEQPNFLNILSTPREYWQEVGIGLTWREAWDLAYPRVLSPSQQELLSWHHRLYHLPFKHLFQLLAWYKLCVACQFGTAHQCQWHCKTKASGSICCPNNILPGDGTSIDQIVLAQPGLIPQMADFPTSNWIWGTTNFCNHVSNFIYVHLMQIFTLGETPLAKQAYEKVLAQVGHRAKNYHANNSSFSYRGFHQDVDDKWQSISFCGVGAHHQNGIIKNRNKHHWVPVCTNGVHHVLAFHHQIMAEHINSLHMDDDSNTPELIMFGVNLDSIPVKNVHTLFCPVYVLDHRLESAGGPGPPK
jgi:hypothetical protein